MHRFAHAINKDFSGLNKELDRCVGNQKLSPLRSNPTGDAVRWLYDRDRFVEVATCLRVSDEAGPTGYVIYWQLTTLGVPCEVVAPTLVPTKAGDRVTRGAASTSCIFAR